MAGLIYTELIALFHTLKKDTHRQLELTIGCQDAQSFVALRMALQKIEKVASLSKRVSKLAVVLDLWQSSTLTIYQ